MISCFGILEGVEWRCSVVVRVERVCWGMIEHRLLLVSGGVEEWWKAMLGRLSRPNEI